MKIDKTERGFELIKFEDHYGLEYSLQQSSAIGDYPEAFEKPGSSCVWLGPGKNDRMHLNREQVFALVAHLNAWLDTGSFETSQPKE